jgi:hypothetical protein
MQLRRPFLEIYTPRIFKVSENKPSGRPLVLVLVLVLERNVPGLTKTNGTRHTFGAANE